MTRSMVDVLLPAAAAVALVVFRLCFDRSERGRGVARGMYTQEAYPLFIRLTPVMAPLIAIVAIVFFIAVLLPRPAGAWLSIPALALASASFLLSYRAQPPFMARWMREEIEDGRLARARPDRIDWVQFWLVLPIAVLGPIAGIVLIVVYGVPGS